MNIQFTMPAGSYESQRLSGFQPAGVVSFGGVMQEEKRWKRGDVREDGMVFWCYDNRLIKNECWLTHDKYNLRTKIQSEYHSKYMEQNKQKERERRRIYYYANIDKYKKWKKEYRFKNSATIKTKSLKYYLANKDRILRRTINAARIKRKSDPLFCLKDRIRSRATKAFASISVGKRCNTESIVGCSWQQVKRHIEKQFVEGMGWHNRSEWHIDHIIPLSIAYDEYSLMMLFHFTNLRPEWARANLSKYSNYNPPEYCI